MAKVKLRNNENFNSLMRRFKRKCDEDKIIQECRERQRFEKPSMVKKKEKTKAIRRAKQKLQKEHDARNRKY